MSDDPSAGDPAGGPPETDLDAEHARAADLSIEIQEVIQAVREGSPAAHAEEIDRLDPERAAALEDRKQDTGLKLTYARALLIMLSAQLLIADGVFVAYAWVGVDWKVPEGVIQVWLGATLVQIIGVVLVVTRYLFPRRDSY